MAFVTTDLPAKRKRAQVSYLIPDDDIDFGSGSDNEAEFPEPEQDDDMPDGDSLYGSRKSKKKPATRKRARLTPLKPKKQKKQKPFPFMSLPPELRDYIYELALVEPAGLMIVSKTKANRRTIQRGMIYSQNNYWNYRRRRYVNNDDSQEREVEPVFSDLVPNLLAVSKQIHAEAIGYLYKQPIILEDTMTMHTFLAAIGANNRNVISTLVVKSWASGRGTHKAMNVAAMTLLSTCPNIKNLVFDCNIGWLRAPKRLAAQLYGDGHYFMEAFGAAKGKKDAAVDVIELDEVNYDRDSGYSYRWYRSEKELPEKDAFKKEFQEELRKMLMKR